LAFQSVNDIKSGDSLTTSVLRVGDSVLDDRLEEHFQDSSALLVNQARDTLHASTTGQTANCGLGDSLDIIAKNLAVTLRTALAKTFTTFAATRHLRRREKLHASGLKYLELIR
jgi:hypothetical protein